MMTDDPTTMNARELAPFGNIVPNARVNHRRQLANTTRGGRRDLAVVGTVTRIGYTANTHEPTVEVTWHGPEGGSGLYAPDQLVLSIGGEQWTR